jgi:hypothetical protein
MLGLLLSLVVAAAGDAQQWIAVSNTAMSITGDVHFSPSRLTFENGQSIGIEYITTWATTPTERKQYGNATSYRLYRVTTSADPVLLKGNKLCGAHPTYFTVAYRAEAAPPGTTILAAFFTGSKPPAQWEMSSTLCAAYTYELR